MGVLAEVLKLETNEARANARGLAEDVERAEKSLDKAAGAARRVEEATGRTRDEMGRFIPAAQRAGRETEALGGGMERANDKVDRFGRQLGRVGGVMSMVSPEAGALTRSLGGVVAVVEIFTAGSAGLLAILGPVAVAVGALAVVWKVLADNAKEAEEAQKRAAKAAQEAGDRKAGRDAFEKQTAAQAADATALGNVNSGALSKDQYRKNQIGAEVAKLFAEDQAQRTAQFEAARAKGDEAGMADAAAALGGITTNIQRMTEERYRSEAALKRERDAEKDATGATRDHTKALEEQEKAREKLTMGFQTLEARLNVAMDQLPRVEEDLLAVAQEMDAVADTLERTIQVGLAWEATLAGLADQQQAAATGEVYRGIIQEGRQTALGGLGALVGGDGAGMAGLLGGASQALAYRGLQQGMAGSGGTMAGLLGVGLSGAAGLMGPMGAVAGLGRMTATTTDEFGNPVTLKGADAVRHNLEGFKEAIKFGLTELPEVLGEVIPDFAVALATELPPALIAALPEIFEAVLRAILPEWAEEALGFGSGGGTLPSQDEQIARGASVATGTGQAGTYSPATGVRSPQTSESNAAAARSTAGRSTAATRAAIRRGAGGAGRGTVIANIQAVTVDGPGVFSHLREVERIKGAGGLREEV